MHINNLKIELAPRLDKDEQIYYIGRLCFPGNIDCSSGVTFLVFLSESGLEELQIAVNDKENSTYSRFTKRDNKLKVKLDARPDKDGNKFYVAKIQFDGILVANKELCFMVFISKEGNEELQISGEYLHNEDIASSPDDIEVIRR